MTKSSTITCRFHGREFTIWVNPDSSEFDNLPEVVRFTADGLHEKIYIWDYGFAMHTDISGYLKLEDSYSSPYFLKGGARKGADGSYTMMESHFLQSFKRNHLTAQERNVSVNLFNQNWDWISKYIKVAEWLQSYRTAMNIS